MKTTILVFRRRTQELEVKAAQKVDQFFKNPFDINEKYKDVILLFLKAIANETNAAEQQGLKFGSYIRKLAIEAQKKTKAKKKINGDSQTPPPKKVKISMADEKNVFILHLNRVIQNYYSSLEIELKKMEMRGMTKDALYRYIRGNAFVIEWKGVQNDIRKRTANFINACANSGYYNGIAGGA